MVISIESFISGVALAGISLFGYAKMKGFNLFALGKLVEAAQAYGELEAEVKEAIGNISLYEISVLVAEAQKLSEGGYTQGELEGLAKKLIDAAASK